MKFKYVNFHGETLRFKIKDGLPVWNHTNCHEEDEYVNVYRHDEVILSNDEIEVIQQFIYLFETLISIRNYVL